MSPMQRSLLWIISLATWATPAMAQALIMPPAASPVLAGRAAPLWSIAPQEADTIERPIKRTYWKEGLLVGAVPGALLGGALSHGICRHNSEEDKSCTVSLLVGAAMGAALLGTPGALIGGLFPKRGSTERPPE